MHLDCNTHLPNCVHSNLFRKVWVLDLYTCDIFVFPRRHMSLNTRTIHPMQTTFRRLLVCVLKGEIYFWYIQNLFYMNLNRNNSPHKYTVCSFFSSTSCCKTRAMSSSTIECWLSFSNFIDIKRIYVIVFLITAYLLNITHLQNVLSW